MTGIGPGSTLGEFVIEAVAGRGGMGVVYRARQLRPERLVAVKVIAPDYSSDPTFRERFERESQIAAQIEHPNVIPVYSVGEDGDVLYIAMRFVDGTDLRTLLADEGQIEPARAAVIVDQIGQALDAAHSRGLVHRDVKPANVLIAAGGREHAYLTDFGLSRHVKGSRGMTATGEFLGTIDYVAPEQVRGERVDARTDVYALGCVLFHVLTGTVPFPLDSDIAKLFAHGSEDPPSARERSPELPAAFDDVLTRAMAKDPADRFPSAGDLGQAALAAVGDEPIARPERNVASGDAAPAPSAARGATPATRPARDGGSPPAGAGGTRRRWLAVAGGVAALVAIGAAAALALGGGDGDAKSGGDGKSAAAGKNAATIPSGDRLVERRRLKTQAGQRYEVAFSVPRDTPGGPSASVPLTMSMLTAEGDAPLKLLQRKRLPSPPYRFAKNSYVSDFSLDPVASENASIDLHWFLHPGGKTITCYFSLSPGGFTLDSCS